MWWMYVLSINIEYEKNIIANTFQMSFSSSLELLHPSEQYLSNLILNYMIDGYLLEEVYKSLKNDFLVN